MINQELLSNPLDRPWTVYLIHHSHTDIGYTETQKRIERRHFDFTEQALNLIQAGDPEGFVWNNECHWALEGWWRVASAERRSELVRAVRAGRFGLSGTFLHFNELVDDHVLRSMFSRSQRVAAEMGVVVDTAITADVNGFSWGYSQALHDSGVHNLLMFLHPAHGLAPLGRRQTPFWWETPRGDKVLVWLGEHYNVGNVMGLCPRGHLTHGLKDEWWPKSACEDGGLIAELRLPRYLNQLALDGYAGNIVPIPISGMTSDNAPPNGEIARFANHWNSRHGDKIRLEMTTAAHFASLVREQFKDIPTHRGDWPDWWSDGYASQPTEVRLCRQAQREYASARSLAEHSKLTLPVEACDRAEQSIALYTEHTFGHSDSVTAPWDGAVKMISGMKRRYALAAVEASEEILDDLSGQLGARPLAPDRPFLYRVVNCTGHRVCDVARLYLEAPDFFNRDMACSIIDLESGIALPAQKMVVPRGMAWGVWLDLGPFESRDLEMQESLLTLSTRKRNCTDFVHLGITTFPDVLGAEGLSSLQATSEFLETPHLRITWTIGGEIDTWLDKATDQDLLLPDRNHGAFTPVYERTPVLPPNNPEAQLMARGRMGRNRKGADVVRSSGRIVAAEPISAGPLFASVRLTFELPGCSMAQLTLTAWKDAPRVDASFCIHKDSVWDPENLYLSLPFTPGGADPQIWLDKTGAAIRPSIDQLPDSLTDFYTLQHGFALVAEGRGLAVACPDAPILQLGPLDHGPRLLMGAPELANRPLQPYGWLMTNYWETNFEAALGGFHEFRYRLEWGPHLPTPPAALAACASLNDLPLTFRAES